MAEGVSGRSASATLLLEDVDNRLLAVKASYKKYWTSPGGMLDGLESPMQAALRETHEEVGILIQPENVTFVGAIYWTDNTDDAWYQFVFQAFLDSSALKTITLQKSEIEAYALVTKQQVIEGDRIYSPLLINWAQGSIKQYDEQMAA